MSGLLLFIPQRLRRGESRGDDSQLLCYSIVARYTASMSKEKRGPKVLPPITDYVSRKEWEIACWEKITGSKELLQLSITAHERHDIVMRVAAIDR